MLQSKVASSDIIYRSARYSDIPALSKIACKSFDFYSFMDNEDKLYKMNELYFMKYYAVSTFSRVAVLDNVPIGFIFGAAKNKRRPLLHFGTRLATIPRSIRIRLEWKRFPDIYKSFINENEVYNSIEPDEKLVLDGQITLFAIDEKYRGLGIGKTLLLSLREHFENENVKRVYLLTDNICDYEFYDRYGFERKASSNIEILRHNKPFELNAFRYEMNLLDWLKK